MDFIQRRGNRLVTNGNATYRFLSFNIPNLHVLEDPYWHRITRWEQEDLLDAVSEMGGQVVRIYAFSIQGPKETTEALKHFRWVNGAWSLNEDLFKDLDQALVLAREHNIRLIVPLIDNWDFWGGIPSFVARQSVSSSSEFYTNPRLRSSFKSMISLVLERRNSLSGIPYKVDPTIMAWETGNELMMNNGRVPYEWTSDIVKHIKSLDPNHLVMDGTFGKVGWEPAALSDPAIDIFSGHYYPMELNTRQIVALSFMGTFTLIILAAIGYASCFPSKLKLSKGFRALEKRNSNAKTWLILSLLVLLIIVLGAAAIILVSHFVYPSFSQVFDADLSQVTGQNKVFVRWRVWTCSIINNFKFPGSICDCFTSVRSTYLGSLRGHAKEGGFHTHKELHGYHAYHYPGFPEAPGFGKDEEAVMSLMKTNMARMPSFRAASIPLKEPIIRSNGRDLTMQGSTGAPKYELRFASTQAGPFTLLKNFVDNQDTGKPFATVSQSGWYQVRAIKGGKNSTSNIVQLI